MKTINSILVACLLIGGLNAYAQTNMSEKYPDTLKISTASDVEITFSFYRISEQENYFTTEFWKSALNIMETAVNRTSLEGGLVVSYKMVVSESGNEARISVTPLRQPGDLIVIKPEETINYTAERVEYQILLEKVAVSFSINSGMQLEEMKNINIESVWSEIKNKYTNEGAVNLYNGVGSLKFDRISIEEITASKPVLDQLEITFIGIGLGYYRDRFVPDLGSKLAFVMYDRLGREWMEYGLLYTRQYFFSRDESNDFDSEVYGFLTAFWKIKNSKGVELGLGIGGIFHGYGDFYEGRTYKLSLYNKGANSRVTFSPELVFTNNFEEIFPALRFGMSF